MIDFNSIFGRGKLSRLALLFLLCLACGASQARVKAKGPDQALRVGDKAPDFDLPIQGTDAYVSLSGLVADGPVVVIVLRGYPGYQCPLCTSQVGAMINRAKRLADVVGDEPQRVVIVYPGLEAGLEGRARRFMGSRRHLPDPMVLVRDPGMEMVKQWGLRWDKRGETAYPAAFLIGPGRRVKWAKVSDSHAGRATVEDVLKAFSNQ